MSENYLIIGNDEYIRRAELEKIKKKFLKESEMDLNFSSYSSDNLDGVMDSLGTVPFLAEKRVVHIKALKSGLDEKDPGSGPDALMELLLKYCEAPSPNSVLILSAEAFFKKKAGYKKLSTLVNVIKADKPDSIKAKGWIRSFFKKEEIDISQQAIDLIVELKGEDTAGIRTELEKLLLFSGGNRIEAEHVKDIVGRSVREEVFKLVDAVMARDSAWALRIVEDLYDQKKSPQEIMGYMGWYIRIMQRITLLTSRGEGPAEITRDIGYSPAYTRRLTGQSKKFPPRKIKKWVDSLLKTDSDIKTGKKSAALALEMLLVSLTS